MFAEAYKLYSAGVSNTPYTRLDGTPKIAARAQWWMHSHEVKQIESHI